MGAALSARWGAPIELSIVAAAVGMTIGTADLNTSGYKVAASMMFFARYGGDTITHVGYRQGTTTGTPASNSYKIGIQGISTTTGNPDGTYLGGGSPASAEFQPTSANDGKWVWVALANSIALTPGQAIALVLETGSGFTVGNKITAGSNIGTGDRSGFPNYQVYNGSWTKAVLQIPLLGLKSANYVYGYPCKTASTQRLFGSTAEAGFWFNIPTQFGSTFKLVGARAIVSSGSGGARSMVLTLYQNPLTGTIAALDECSGIDLDFFPGTGSQYRILVAAFTGSTAPTLTCGTDYCLGFATTTANDSMLWTMDQESASDWGAWPYEQQCGYTTRTLTSYPPSGDDTNNFAAVTAASRPFVELLLADITPPGGTNIITGGFAHPNLRM